ncbi:hypothetical protein Ddye_017126 [Dipteronia dyeriana]|uniref:Uncharacterized protein n=1 Tax=Dipteronia dyeriana TaxID=168575 RepID=A0AAD9X0W6_9ROSI|nr:hypothetical protein Ddye_017126 [Dipteronia dyeriana]
MGNYTSSCIYEHSRSHKTKIIDSNGHQREVNVPIKAAEVMIEEPGHVICPVDELLRTHRVSPMKADDGLLAGKVYVLFSVARVNRKVKEEELETLINKADRKKRSLLRRRRKSTSGEAKVLLAVNEEVRDEEGQFTVSGGTDTGFSGYRLGNPKLWSPVLAAIPEINVLNP